MEMEMITVTAKPRKLNATWTVEQVQHGMDMVYFVNEIWIRKAYHGEWAIDVPLKQWHDVIAWCAETLGADGRRHVYRWRKSHSRGNCRIFLRHESDVLMFRLKWENT